MKNRFRYIGLLLVLVLFGVAILSGCAEQSRETGASGSSSTGQLQGDPSEEYYMCTFLSGHEFWRKPFQGMEDAAKLYGVTAVYLGTPEQDINGQVTVLEQIIAKKPAGITITCIDPDAYTESINKSVAAGIPVVTFDSDAPKSDRISFIATGNYDSGVAAARYMAELLGDEGEVGIVKVVGQLNLEQRAQGFKETIENEYPNMKVIQEVDGEGTQEKSAQVATAMIQANPNLKGIFASFASAGVGASVAVKETNKVGAIKIISFDTDTGTLDALKEGTISATLAQGTYNWGYWSLQFLYQFKHELMNPFDGWKEKGVVGLPQFVDTGITIVTNDNADLFYTE